MANEDTDAPVEGWLLRSSPSANSFLKAPAHVQCDICKREREVWDGIKHYEGARYGNHYWLDDPLHMDEHAPVADEDLVPPVSWSDASKALWPRLGRALRADVVRFEMAASKYFEMAAKRGRRLTQEEELEQWRRQWEGVFPPAAEQWAMIRAAGKQRH